MMNGELGSLEGGLWGRGRKERDWRETRDAGLVYLVGPVN
jgi:hypothetical protein